MADILRLLFNSMQTGSNKALAALGIALIWTKSRTTNFAQRSIVVGVKAISEQMSRLMGVPTRAVTMISWAAVAMMRTLTALVAAPKRRASTQHAASGVLGGFSSFEGAT